MYLQHAFSKTGHYTESKDQMKKVAVFCIKGYPSVEHEVHLPGGRTKNRKAVVLGKEK